VDTISYPWAPILWDSGDFDNDGLYDLVMQCGCVDPYWVGITIFESPDSFSYPSREVWRDTVGPSIILPLCAYDIDRDGLPEIVMNSAEPYGELGIYKSIGNNQYGIIFVDNPDTSLVEAPEATIAFSDFDNDGAIEFVAAGSNQWYWIYECTGNNSFHKVNEGQLPTGNIRDCFSVADADRDGKPEFVIKGFEILNAKIDAFIFEATGNNTYAVVKSFTFPGGDYYGGYSDAGDVDGDSIPEIVLEARQHVYIIKAAGNDSFYVWDSLPGNTSGSSVRVTNDIDGNGLNEIIVSGNNQTRIYEYVPGAIEETPLHFSPDALHMEVYPNPFTQNLNIKLETHATGKYSIKVYDVSGGLVNSIYNGAINRNTVINWNGSDENGRAVSQGVYFLKIENLETKVIEVFKVLRTR
jgi:uncharacterized membrane protein